ncbi:right-handed parallel beta-helix repeat-containing protein [Neobacillus niacini]|uniref:right-handed parallel beta-helix repeat-containing protein n=1 Tax=Neobacillus niacini TaxID=86668 RepID=UPI00052FBF62|nr:right-handed parallel beta-helix repeat-containing protein [Neobacillus niacini]KGM46268.1 hypothetical protein NP83_01165 [Neobacillus niacini]MEC1525652.1 right-handed parallel beta-helix repeat-containing protein [Neobacillus niacini]
MEKEILLNQLEKIITNINSYKINGDEKKNSISALDFEILEKQVKNSEFVITVVGAMKSGKSSFTNALLGNDLMPNENQACTLTSTDIIHQVHDFKIKKSYESGKNEIMQSENLSSVFHEDVRRSRSEIQKEFYTYKVNHPIYGLRKFPFLNTIDFILMDTPGLNEMEGLGVKKETIEQVFSNALKRTDLLLFIIDVQYYKAEENLQIIEKIKELRPDLLNQVVFVLNKVDKLRDRDGTSKDVVHKVREFFNSWGVNTRYFYPVSARKALIGRLVEQDAPIENFKDEITSFLPTKTIEMAGQAVTVQVPISSAYPQLIEDSGIIALEDQILEEAYLQVENKLLQSTLVRLSQLTDQVDTALKNGISRNQTEILKVQSNIDYLKLRLSSLESIHEEESKYRNELEAILRSIQSQAETMRREMPYSSKLTAMPEKKSSFIFTSSSDALQAGISKFDEWFYKNTEPKFQSILSHYQAMLEFNTNESNYFYIISQSVSRILRAMNRVISINSKKLPDIKFHNLIERLDIRPQGLTNIPSVDWKYKQFSEQVTTDSKTTEWEESFLIFFTQKRSKTDYAYISTGALGRAERHIQATLDKYSKEWHLDTIQKRFVDTSKYVQEMVLKPLTQLHNKVTSLIKETSEECFRLESILANLQTEVIDMKELKDDVCFRTDIVSRRKSITVTAKNQNLDSILSKVESGTTIYLDEGTFILKQNHELNKSISIVGLGIDLSKIKIETGAGITVKGSQGLFLEGITFESSKVERIAELDCLEFFAESCKFVGNRSRSAIFIKGKTEGFIQRSSFSAFDNGITLLEQSRVRIRNNEFITNNCGVHLIDHGWIELADNVFTDNITGVTFGDSSSGAVERNNLSKNTLGMVINDFSKPVIMNNQFNHQKQYGISINKHANIIIDKNLFTSNTVGINCSDNSKAVISKNTFLHNLKEGIRIGGHSSGEIKENRIEQNHIGITIASKGSTELSQNQIIGNLKHGVVCKQGSVLMASSNQIQLNHGNGLKCEGNSQVTLLENIFSSNRNGIHLTGQSKFDLVNNQCLENKENGITIQDQSIGRIHHNQFNQNKNGIHLSGKCRVFLVENHSNDNMENGIVCQNKVSGKISNNSCQGNGSYAILLEKPLLIHLRKNSGKGKIERLSSIHYWFNQCRKALSNLRAIIKKKEIFHNEY